MSGSDIFKLAENMERRSKKQIKELKISLKLENPADGKGGLAFGAGESSDEEGQNEDEENKGSKKSKSGEGQKNGTVDDEDDDFGYDPERYVPFNEKVEFAELIKRATKEGVTSIMNYLLEKQPEALEDYGNDRL